MSAPEKRLWQYLKDNLPKECLAERIENTTSSGMPDVHLFYEGRDYYVELKAHPGILFIRKYQHAWAMKRHAFGGKSFILHHDLKDNTLTLHQSPFEVAKFNETYVTVIKSTVWACRPHKDIGCIAVILLNL